MMNDLLWWVIRQLLRSEIRFAFLPPYEAEEWSPLRVWPLTLTMPWLGSFSRSLQQCNHAIIIPGAGSKGDDITLVAVNIDKRKTMQP